MSSNPHTLHTFGCSFTSYIWSTWADILGQQFESFRNYGLVGAGNTYIFNRVMQSIAQEKIKKDDTVIVMWSTIVREDRFLEDKWQTPGCVYNQDYYDEGFMKYVQPEDFFIRDLAHIAAVYHALTSVGCKFTFTSMSPISHIKEYLSHNFLDKLLRKSIIDRFTKKYKTYIDFIRPSVFEVIYNNNWYSRYSECVQDINWYNSLRGPDWPSLTELELGNVKLSTEVEQEICHLLQANNIDEVLKFRLWKKIDYHPTPKLHLEYLDKVLPEIKISEQTRTLINEEQIRLLEPQV